MFVSIYWTSSFVALDMGPWLMLGSDLPLDWREDINLFCIYLLTWMGCYVRLFYDGDAGNASTCYFSKKYITC